MRTRLIACILLVLNFTATAQSIDETLDRHAREITTEKAWLHLDKSAYAPGENIWFKAYVLEDIFPADKSKTLYIDWLSPNGDVLSHTVSPVIEGTTNGQFTIPADYKHPFIHARAYTRWMLNFDTAFLYNKNIPVLNKQTATKAKAVTPGIRFFPEGGDIIAGVMNRVAFKVTDQWGQPARIKGYIRSEKENFVDSLRIQHDGMGSFYLQPSEGTVYTAKWKDEKGIEHTTPLPAVRSIGVSMQVTNNGGKKLVTLQGSSNLPEQLKTLHLIGTMNGKKAFQTDLTLSDKQSAVRLIPTEGLPSGILTFTLFDASWNAIAERISFINNQEYSFQPSMEVITWGLGKRKRNEIEITIPDSLQGVNLSISVTDLAIEKDSSENIISHFLLTSDIRGRVHDPAYYFAGPEKYRSQHLDLVMMTHGWRRFKWEDLAKGKLPKISYPRDTVHLNLSGQVFGVPKSVLSGNEVIALFIKEKDSLPKMSFMEINKEGRFGDPTLIFFDTLQVYYSLKSKAFHQAEARFMTERLPTPDYTGFSAGLGGTHIPDDTSGAAYHRRMAAERLAMEEAAKTKVLETVIVKTKTKPPLQVMDEKYASGLFSGGDGYQFDMVNNPMTGAYMSIFNFLQGRVPGLMVSTGVNPSLTWRGGTPQLYLDEFPTDASMINNIPVSDIAYVKVFRPPFFGTAGGGANGAIAIYTKKGDDAKAAAKGLSTNTIYGYTPIREFYSPNYDRFDRRHADKDIRTTLYWNPQVVISPGKKTIRLTFYNNDISSAFRVVIEGMSREGLITHYEQVME